jgi:AraC-like DNA-binding protein
VDVLSDAVGLMRTGRPHSSYVRLPAPFGRAFPAGEAVGFHAVVRGACWLFPDDGDPIALAPGDVAFLPRGSAHGIADSPSTRRRAAPRSLLALAPGGLASEPGAHPGTTLVCGAYAVDRRRIHPLLGGLPDVLHLPAGTAGSRLRSVLEFLQVELENPRPGAAAVVPALLDLVLLEVLRRWLAEVGREKIGWGAALGDPHLAPALQAVHDRPEAPWSVGGLAATAGLSRSAFSRRFTAFTGQPPLTYLTWWRMVLATRLLRDTDAPVAAVARQVGYSSEFAFGHAFKRAHGVSPGRFRTQEQLG